MLDKFQGFFIRVSAFFRKEIISIVRQPRLLFSLILGPFLILLIFGFGYQPDPRTLRTLFVVPEDSEIIDFIEDYSDSFSRYFEFIGMTSDQLEANQELRERDIDLVVVTPLDPTVDWEQNEQSKFSLYHSEIDPIEATYIEVLGERTIDAVNESLLLRAVDEAKQQAADWQTTVRDAQTQATAMRTALEQGNEAIGREAASQIQNDISLLTLAAGSGLLLASNLGATDEVVGTGQADELTSRLDDIEQNLNDIKSSEAEAGNLDREIEKAKEVETDLERVDVLLTRFQEMDSKVMVGPFRSETLNINNRRLDPTHFYIPGVLSLLLQHIAITMAGLSIVRETQNGTTELFRASPTSSLETLIGKYLAFFLLTAATGVVLTLLTIWGLNAPPPDHWGFFTLALGGVIAASLGIGFLISLLARTDSQAIQYAMILLLSSIFFSGFFLPLYRLFWPVQIISWLLPATYGTSLLQSIMLRGQPGSPLHFAGLAAFSVVLFLVAWWGLRALAARD